MLLYIVQIFSFFAMMMSALSKKRKNILIWVFIANFSNFLVMLVAQEMDGWMGSLATTMRALLFLYKDKAKTNTILYIGLGMHLIAFALSYQDIFSFCILFATFSVCLSQWLGKNPLQIKIGALLSIFFWIVYTLHIGLYLDLPKRIVEGVLLIVSMIKIVSNQKQEQKIDNKK